MSDERNTICDACGVKVKSSEATNWLNVRVIVGTVERYQELLDGPDVNIDSGDFCTLVCLANWSSARANMKTLEEGLGA